MAVLTVLTVALILALCRCIRTLPITKDEYTEMREKLLGKEYQMRTGGTVNLSATELHVNAILMDVKRKELEIARRNVTNFPPAVHFFHAKELIDDSEVFRIIRSMPKGADLHVHEGATVDVRWLIKNATYDPHCFMCTNHVSGSLAFHFFDTPPSSDSADCNWRQVNEVRKQADDPATFDEMLYKQLTFVVDEPEKVYPTTDVIWARFVLLFGSTLSLMEYGPVLRAYAYQSLQQLYDDGVQYAEIRTLLLPVYELDGTVHDSRWVLEAHVNVTQQFVRDHPDFIGAKFICTKVRGSENQSSLAVALDDVIKLRAEFPDYLAGLDIVGHEDSGPPLTYFIDTLLIPSQTGVDLPYFLHAGETNWKDEDIDMNLMDAYLLNVTRIGHGFAINKHPLVRQLLETRRIPLEICPISNQVLMLVNDIRNHPAAELMSSNFPMVIGSDDPAMWGAVGLSYDFYEAFMGLGGAWADLATLKQLAINSIQYSSLSDADKAAAFILWQKKWDRFIEQTLEMPSYQWCRQEEFSNCEISP